jgi:F-type H+-transporting ATPase subunit delta
MKTQILVKRYANGLVDSIQNDKEFSRIFKQIESFHKMVTSSQDLSDVLLKPFIPKSKAEKVVEELLNKAKSDQKVIRFILLLIENERVYILGDVIKVLPEAWNEKKGLVTIEVSTAVPLKKNQKNRLKKKLEKIEKKPVWLKYKIDKEIIGGLSIRRENTFFDVSIRGDLMRLSEKIKQGS